MKKGIGFLIFLTVIGIPCSVFSQRSITGPTCVLTGMTYQYDLKPKWDGSSEMTLCIQGGSIENVSSACIKTVSLPYIRVIWDEGVDKGSIYYSYGEIKDSLVVNITIPLLPGAIDAEKKVQKLTINRGTPQPISSTASTGGNCSPAYNYQWQQSVDGENWEDLAESKSQNLSFKAAPAKTTLYRRKTTESKSGTVAYSEVSTIVIEPEDIRRWNQ